MIDHEDLESLRNHGAEVFDGFVVVGIPVSEVPNNMAPVCTIRNGIDTPRAERLIWHLRNQADMLEAILSSPPAPPQLPGDEWKAPH